MRLFRILTAVMALISLTACAAKVVHKPVVDDTKATGIRYYRAAPYLLVYSNSKGGLKWQILYLPDQTTKMEAKPKVAGGHSELTMYFQNGVLTSSSELGDTTAVPKALISAVQSAIPLLTAAMAVEKSKVPPPYLYKIVVKNGTINFYGAQGDAPIVVPSLQQGS
ncbi:hypothetical protein GMSM_44310 [Geomonas sp. Red276]